MAKSKSREVNGVTIQSGVPIPAHNGIGRFKYPWDQLEIGESMFIAGATMSKTSGSFQYASMKLGRKFARRSENGGVRVWRTA